MALKFTLRFLLLVVGVFGGHLGFGQSSAQDSLLASYLDEQLPDSVRIQALLALGNSSYRYDSLLYYHQDFSEVILAKGSPKEIIEHHLQIGQMYFRTDRFTESLPHLQEAEKLAIEIQDTMRLIRALGWQGNTYGSVDNPALSLKKYYEAIVLAEQIGNERIVYITEGNIGVQYQYQKEYDKALTYYEQNLATARQLGDTMNICRRLSSIGKVYLLQGELDTARPLLRDARELAEKYDYAFLLALTLSRIGELELKSNEYSAARITLAQALELAKETKQELLIIEVTLNLARLNRTSNSTLALQLAEEALLKAQMLNDITNQADANKLLTLLYEDRGQYQLALAKQEQWKILSDSFTREENQRALYLAEAEFEYEKQKLKEEIEHEQEITQQQLNTQSRYYLLLGGVVLLVLALISVLRYQQVRNSLAQQDLLHQLNTLKGRLISPSQTATENEFESGLDRKKLEQLLDQPINDAFWKILLAIYHAPSLSNQQLADELDITTEELSGALRNLYQLFEIRSESKHNMKVALMIKVVQLSIE